MLADNISKLNSSVSVKLLQLPLQGSGKALGDNLEAWQKRFWYATFIGFPGCCVVWLAGLYACFRKVAPLALPVEVFALVHCHHTPTLPLHPPPPARALSRLVSSSQGMAGLAWHGMVWLGVRVRCFHNEVR